MLIYSAIPILFYILSHFKINEKSYSKLCILIIGLISALRFNVGVDYGHYTEQIELINSGLNYREIEFSFLALVNIINFFGLPDYFVISIYSIFTAYFVYLNLKMVDFDRKLLYFWTFFPHFYLQSFNLIRMMLAVVIVWYAIQNLKQKKKYFLLIFLAMCFHATAIFGVVIYFVLAYKIRGLAKVAIFGLIFFIAQTNLVNNLLEYTNYRALDNDYNDYYDYKLFLLLFLFWLFLEIYNFKPFYKDLAFLSVITPLFVIISHIQGDLLYRISYYSMIFIPVFLSSYKLKYINIDLNLIFCTIILPLYFIYNLAINGASFQLVPYKFIPLFNLNII
jgi:hypothetical protein